MTKEEIKMNFEAGDVPTQNDFASLVDSQVGVLNANSELPSASSLNAGVCYLVGGDTIYRCEMMESGNYSWVPYPFTTSSVNSYLNLTNKPRINGVVVSGDKDSSELGLADEDHTHLYAGSSSEGGKAQSVEHVLGISINGKSLVMYDGSTEESVDITFEKLCDNVEKATNLNDEDILLVADDGGVKKVTMSQLKEYIKG